VRLTENILGLFINIDFQRYEILFPLNTGTIFTLRQLLVMFILYITDFTFSEPCIEIDKREKDQQDAHVQKELDNRIQMGESSRRNLR